jgi:DNA-binding NarL/FixJ family response regulator
MIIPPDQLEKALGTFQGRFLLACLSSGFEPTVVYAAGSQLQLANLYHAMGANRGDCLGACTTGAAALEHLGRVKPNLLLMCDDLLDMTIVSLMDQAKELQPAIRTIAIISNINQFNDPSKSPIIVADQDLLVHAETVTLMTMAVATRRERQLLEAYALGLSNQETAKQLCLSPRTVQTYSSQLL